MLAEDILRKQKASLIRAVHCSGLWRSYYRDDRAAYERLLADNYGVKSSKDMAAYQLADLLNYLNGRQKQPSQLRSSKNFRQAGTPDGTRTRGGNVDRFVTGPENRKIAVLSGLIRWKYENGLGLWMKKRFGIESVRTSRQAHQVIEGLKAMFENQMESGSGPEWRSLRYNDPKINGYIARHSRKLTARRADRDE